MNDIICPHCRKAFRTDDAGYADILKQVRASDFEHQPNERLELAERDKRSAVELACAQLTAELQKQGAEPEAEILKLRTQLEAGEVARQLALAQALSDVESQRDALACELAKARPETQTVRQLAEAQRMMAGADKGYGRHGFIKEFWAMKVTPHVARNTRRTGGSAIDGRTTRHGAYAMSRRRRKCIAHRYRCGEAIGPIRPGDGTQPE